MRPKLIFLTALSMVLATGLGTPFTFVRASSPVASAATPASEMINRTEPLAIGALRPAGQHLVRPRPEVVERMLKARGSITPGMTTQQLRAAKEAYFKEFSRTSSVWVSPEVQIRALSLSSDTASTLPAVAAPVSARRSSPSIQPVTAKILVLAVEFGGSDTFTFYGNDGSGCKTRTVTTSGPLKGEIPAPGPRDNNTVWYEPSLTANASFYEKLIFGYEGVGRVRLDLKDPDDNQTGINLAGYTVQDYYDHMAGVGNVLLEGSAQGWVTVPHSEGYYGAPGCAATKHDDAGPGARMQLVVDALQQFMAEHPDYYTDNSTDAFWKQFDANGDGVVDSLWIIHAGMGQEAGGGLQGDYALWSHSADLRDSTRWSGGYPVYQGKNGTGAIVVGPYTMLPENADLGVLVEEFGHNFFGLPDLYTNDIQNSIGFWSIMSAGSWAGWLGGATPVGMPLWFRMIAQCGNNFCNWQAPLLSLSYNAGPRTVTIGQLENTPEGLYKGVKITLPDVVKTGEMNRAGTGKGAYTGTGVDNLDISLDRPLTLSATAKRLTFKSYWDIEEDRDYGYVMLKVDNHWVFLKDLNGVMRSSNPCGNNLGHGLTGTGNQKLSFDMTPYRGKRVILRLRYKTDATTTGAGWWVDDLALDGQYFSRFEETTPPATFPGRWRNSSPGWVVRPTAGQSYPNYYLIEWRNAGKYDRMVRTAYAKNIDDGYEWKVERIPYNIPGALIYYCNSLYDTTTYELSSKLTAKPSIGPKYPLLLVDMNYGPMHLDNKGTLLDSRIASYDAALTLQPTEPFTISSIVRDGTVIEGPWTFASKPPVTLFDDSLGYYAGLFAGTPCEETYCYANEGGSAVIPAMGQYTTRITHFDGTPYPELYGKKYKGSYLGTGNPGDENLQWGVTVELLSTGANNESATLRLNAP